MRARTGPVGTHSATGLPVMAATSLPPPDFQPIVAQGDDQFVPRPPGAPPVGEERSGGWPVHFPSLLPPIEAGVRYPMPGMDTASPLLDHLCQHAVRTDGPFTLRSGAVSDWYIDARQTTLNGEGARLVGAAVFQLLRSEVRTVGGMTMGADPIAMAAAMHAAWSGREIRAFSVRKREKEHGLAGRLAGPVEEGDKAAIVEDTVTTGGALAEAVEVAKAAGLQVVQIVVLVDRSAGAAEARAAEWGIPYEALATPADLGVGP